VKWFFLRVVAESFFSNQFFKWQYRLPQMGETAVNSKLVVDRVQGQRWLICTGCASPTTVKAQKTVNQIKTLQNIS